MRIFHQEIKPHVHSWCAGTHSRQLPYDCSWKKALLNANTAQLRPRSLLKHSTTDSAGLFHNNVILKCNCSGLRNLVLKPLGIGSLGWFRFFHASSQSHTGWRLFFTRDHTSSNTQEQQAEIMMPNPLFLRERGLKLDP